MSLVPTDAEMLAHWKEEVAHWKEEGGRIRIAFDLFKTGAMAMQEGLGERIKELEAEVERLKLWLVANCIDCCATCDRTACPAYGWEVPDDH